MITAIAPIISSRSPLPRRRLRIAMLTAPLLVAWLVGCGYAGPRVKPGTYEGFRPIDSAPGADPVVVKQLSRVRMTVAADGTVAIEDGGIPKVGHLHYESGPSVEIEAIAGQSMERQPPALRAQSTFVLRQAPHGGWIYPDGTVLRPKPVETETPGVSSP